MEGEPVAFEPYPFDQFVEEVAAVDVVYFL